MCNQDPLDFSLLMLKILAKCCGGNPLISSLLSLIRVITAILIDLVEVQLLSFAIFDLFEEGEGGEYFLIIVNVVLTVFLIVVVIALSFLWGYAERDGLDDDEKKIRRGRCFLVFKFCNVIFAGVLTAGAIYKDGIDFESLFAEGDAVKIFLVVSLGMDIIFDPIEAVIGTCIHCRN